MSLLDSIAPREPTPPGRKPVAFDESCAMVRVTQIGNQEDHPFLAGHPANQRSKRL